MQRGDLILNLFHERRLADVTFEIDGEEVKVHKAILATECSYFHTMLFGATNEANATKIVLKETPLKQFKEVIRFCYLHRVKIGGWRTEEVCNLLSLAHEYNYELLLKEIAKEIRDQSMLNPLSLPVFYDSAVALNLKQILKAIKSYVAISDVESEQLIGYSADLVSFICNNVVVTPSTIKALWQWKASHTDQEVEQVFKSIYWEVVHPKILAEVIRVLVPYTNLSKVPEPEIHQEPEPGRYAHPMEYQQRRGYRSSNDRGQYYADYGWRE